VVAAVSTLERVETNGGFAPGELNALVEEGELDSARGNVFDGEQVFAELRKLSTKRRGKPS
jgi:hypothetical protein